MITETYAEKRTADDWKSALEEGLSGLDVTIIQNVNDAGSAIKKYNESHHKQANESPDLFHILNKTHSSIVGPLSSKKRSVAKRIEKASKKLALNTAKSKRISDSSDKRKHKKIS